MPGVGAVDGGEVAVCVRGRSPHRAQRRRVAEARDRVQRDARDHRRIELADPQPRKLRQLGTTGVAVLAEVAVEPLGAGVDRGVEARCSQEVDRQQVCLRRVGIAEADAGPAEVAQVAHRGVDGRHEVGAPADVGVAHRERHSAPSGRADGLDVREVGVPRQVDGPGEERVHLRFVAVEEDGFDRCTAIGEPLFEGCPDRADLRVVHDRGDAVAAHVHAPARRQCDKTACDTTSVRQDRAWRAERAPTSPSVVTNRLRVPAGSPREPPCP
jgi:hypothetical protein